MPGIGELFRLFTEVIEARWVRQAEMRCSTAAL